MLLLIFAGSLAPVSETARIRFTRVSYFDNRLQPVDAIATLTTPEQYNPYAMTFIDAPPSSWIPPLEVFDPLIDADILWTVRPSDAQSFADER